MPSRSIVRRVANGTAGGRLTAAISRYQVSWPIWASMVFVAGAIAGMVAVAAPPKAAIALVALPAVIAVVIKPRWLPPLLVVTLFIESLSVAGLAVSRLAGPLALVVVLVRLTAGSWPTFPRKSIFWAVGAYVVWAFASVIWTVNPDNSFDSTGTGYAVASLALSLSYMAAFAVLVENRSDLRRLGVTIWATAALVGLVAIAQYLLSGYGRAVAYEGDANFFAALQVISLPACVVVAGRLGSRRLRAIGYLGAAIVVGSVFVSLSRGGLLALVGVVLLVAIQPYHVMFRSQGDKKIALIAILLGAGVLFYGAYGDLVQRGESLFTTADGGSGRTNLWRAAETGWQEHEVHGLGYGAFPSQSNRLLLRSSGVDFSAYRLRYTGQVTHSAYIGTLVELGVVGAALLVAMLVALINGARWSRREALRADDDLVASAATALVIAIAGFMVLSIFLSTETDRSFWVMLGLTLAMGRIAIQLRERGRGVV